jgi:hypothetical protein
MDTVLRSIQNVIVYIDDLRIYTQDHYDFLKDLDQFLQ